MSEKSDELKSELIESIGKQLPDKITVVWQENEAEVIHEQNAVHFNGILSSPLAWLQKRIDLINQKESHVIVTPDSFQIELITEERFAFKNRIVGKLEYDTTFLLFKINTDSFRSAKDWAALVKKHKWAFESITEANDLMVKLLNYKAKVQTEVEKGKDAKGNVKDNYERIVIDNNLPEKFILNIPIFKGQKPVPIDVEFEVNDTDLSLSAWSDFVQVEAKRVLDASISEQVEQIQNLAPDLVVFFK